MEKPNILFMHVDQMHADVISAFGCEHVHTPNAGIQPIHYLLDDQNRPQMITFSILTWALKDMV